jgi:hypothetical protein
MEYQVIIGSKEVVQRYLPELLRIDEEAFAPENWLGNNFTSELPMKFEQSLIALHNNTVVGFCFVYAPDPDTLHISRFIGGKIKAIKGLGSDMIKKLKLNAVAIPVKRITLEFDHRLGVEGFYTRCGFAKLPVKAVKGYLQGKSKTAKEHMYIGPGSTRAVMECIL